MTRPILIIATILTLTGCENPNNISTPWYEDETAICTYNIEEDGDLNAECD